jgi:hypothetical protein
MAQRHWLMARILVHALAQRWEQAQWEPPLWDALHQVPDRPRSLASELNRERAHQSMGLWAGKRLRTRSR